MARRYGNIMAGKLKHTSNHIRETMGTEDELRALGISYVNRPVNPIICLPDFEVVDGNRRLAAVLLVAGPNAEVPICITDESIDESVKLEIMMQSAIHTRSLKVHEEYVGARQWLEQNPGATAEQLGERIGRKPAMMSRLLSLSRCIPSVKEAAASGLIGVTEWYELSKCAEQQQHELLAARLSGQVGNRDQLAQAARKSRSKSTPAIKLTRVNFVLPTSGVRIVVSGSGQTLDDLHDTLSDALREVRKSRDQSMDIRAFQAVMASKNKKRE
jgi:ParB-like chromosome segregation protein Spo0J